MAQELVAVAGPHHAAATLKRELLFFDRIAYPGVAVSLDYFRRYPHVFGSPDFANELEWLVEQGHVFDPDVKSRVLNAPSHIVEGFANFSERQAVALALGKAALAAPPDANTVTASPALIDLLMSDLYGWGARLFSIILRDQVQMNVVPICQPVALVQKIDLPVARTEVLHLVLKEFPIPDEATSLEDVLAFRDEMHRKGLPQELRVWMNDLASGKLTTVEIGDKLEALTHRCRVGLEAHGVKAQASTLEFALVAAADVIGDIVKANFGTAIRRALEIRRRQAELAKEELGLPGREVAYIVRAQERFGE